MNVDNFREWELQVEANREVNFELLTSFRDWLIKSNISEISVENHLVNVNVFANTFLIEGDVTPLTKGISEIGEYFGNFFISNAPIANSITLAQNVKSILLLYSFLNSIDLIPDEEFVQFQNSISNEQNNWEERCETYHSGCEF